MIKMVLNVIAAFSLILIAPIDVAARQYNYNRSYRTNTYRPVTVRQPVYRPSRPHQPRTTHFEDRHFGGDVGHAIRRAADYGNRIRYHVTR